MAAIELRKEFTRPVSSFTAAGSCMERSRSASPGLVHRRHSRWVSKAPKVRARSVTPTTMVGTQHSSWVIWLTVSCKTRLSSTNADTCNDALQTLSLRLVRVKNAPAVARGTVAPRAVPSY